MSEFKRVYLDYAAATPTDSRVIRAMESYQGELFANPLSLHSDGLKIKDRINNARALIAKLIGAKQSEIIFTSGGTESNNSAIFGVAREYRARHKKGGHVIFSAIEHASLLNTKHELDSLGVGVSIIPVKKNGAVDPARLEAEIRSDTFLVSIMAVNNEIGTIEPIRDIGKIIKNYRKKISSKYPLFHSDASQAPRYMHLEVETLGVDLLSIDGGKIYGPKGIGALYIRRETPIRSTTYGGHQEGGMRSGTQNVSGIIGLSVAYQLCEEKRKEEMTKLSELRDKLFIILSDVCVDHVLNSDIKESVPGIVNVYFPNINSEQLMIELDVRGVSVSIGSACGSVEGKYSSHVILALPEGGEKADSSVRFSFGKENTMEDMKYLEKVLKEVFNKKVRLSQPEMSSGSNADLT